MKFQKVDSADEITKYKDSHKVAVLKMSAPWCGPCKTLEKELKKASDDYSDDVVVLECNIDDNEELANDYNVSSIPHVVFFYDGKLQDLGVKGAHLDKIKKMINDGLGGAQ